MPNTESDGNANDGEAALSSSASNAKRQQVTAACQQCRQAKAKCDARRPCHRCRRRQLNCLYTGMESETPQQTMKRSHNEMNQFLETLRSVDERQAIQIVRRIRNGDEIKDALQNAHPYDTEPADSANHLRRKFLNTLIQSTAPLPDLIRLASLVLLNPQSASYLPDMAAYEPLRDCVVTIESLTSVLAQNNPDIPLLTSGSNPTPMNVADGFNGTPPYWAVASHWTTITQSDDVVSHLVSTFLALVNGYWRFLEQDIFLKSLRKGRPSEYCSAFLFHAILACASLYTEIDEAFATPGQLLTRGAHFYAEAERLWTLDMDRPSVASVQALFILAMYCSIRGKDKAGLEFKGQAVVMHKALTGPIRIPRMVDEKEATRVRQCLAWAVLWMDFSYALGLLTPFETITSSLDGTLDDLSLILPDTVVYWVSYPLTQEPIATRMNMFLQQRCELNVLIARLMRLLFSNAFNNQRQKVEAVAALGRDVAVWLQNLPTNLCYRAEMSVTLYEFHGQYLSVQMTFHNRALEVFQQSPSPAEGDLEEDELENCLTTLRRGNLMCAHQTAQFLQDFRRMYGYKITPTAIMHAAALATGILLRYMQEAQNRTGPVQPFDGSHETPPDSPGALKVIHRSFEECFQCLLGMGMQNLLPRAIARTIYRGAMSLKIQLPENTVKMLQIVSESAWQPTDLHDLNSMYPNWILPITRNNGTIAEQMPYWLEKWERMESQDASLMTGVEVGG